MKNSTYFFSAIAAVFILLAVLSSCKTKTEIVTETVIHVDTVEVVIQDNATTFIISRHAETEEGDNPSLSEEGQSRAQLLSEMLQHVDLHTVYATDYNRTQETAQVIADEQGLTVTEYDPEDQNAMVEEVLALDNETVMIVGHSNTVPELLNILVGSQTYLKLTEDAFDNLFIVQVYEEGNAEVMHLTY